MSDTPVIDVAAWLTDLGLGDYAQAFIDNDVDAEVLGSLTAEDLRELGVTSIGHRRRILTESARLYAEPDAVAVAEPAPSPPPAGQSAERRNLTVMFCDLMDSTALSVNVDPEDFRDYIARYRHVLEEAIRPFAGHVAQFLGDGIFVYFGYPRSVEHDAENAVAAGLAILQSIATMEPFGGHQPQARIGIATGLTVVGATDKAREMLGDSAVGETPNLAARLQAIAGANTVIVAPTTRKLIGNLFECSDLGSFDLKGFEDPVRAWRVDGHSRSTSRFGALRAGQRSTDFVGRELEMTRLRHRLAEARTGHGQFVVIVGESGFGKSRLARQIIKEASEQRESQPILQCTPYNVGSAFHPLRRYIEQISGVTHQDAPAEAIEKLSEIVALAGPVSPESIALIAELARVSGADIAPLLGLSSQERRNRTMALLLSIMQAIARDSVAITLEDIQWIDPSTAELIERLLPSLDDLPLLLVATMRPQPYPPWLANSKARFVLLERFGPDDIIRLIRAAADGVEVPDTVMEVIVTRSDGIPIFVEELARGYVDAAAEGRDVGDEIVQIPDSLADSLLARLDRLKIGRNLALVAAVIGHEFPIAVLVAVSGLAEAEARAGIDELLEANVLFVGHSPFGEAISFRHMLLREAAYKLLLRRDRVTLHGQVAHKLVAEFPQIAEAVPHVVALHLEQAGEFKDAALEWDRAGDQAAKRSAYAESVTQIEKAIAANDRCEDSQERDERELSYRLSLTSALIASRGFSAGGVAAEMEKAVLLSKKTGTTAKLIPALTSKWIFLGSNDQANAMYDLAVQIGEAAKTGSDVDKLLAHRVMATTCVFSGKFSAAIHSAEQFFALYDFDLHEEGLSVVGPSNHAIMMMVGLAESYTIFADFEAADHWQTKALDAADKNGQLHNICHVVLFAGCFLAELRNQNETLVRHADRLKSLSNDNNLPYWQSHADLFHGLSMIRRGQDEEGIVEARRGVKGLIASQAFNICWFIIYADACEKSGRHAEAAEYLTRVKPSQDQGEMWMAAEYHRISGRIILAQDGPLDDAQKEFQTALEIANTQGADLFAERARADLAALDTQN